MPSPVPHEVSEGNQLATSDRTPPQIAPVAASPRLVTTNASLGISGCTRLFRNPESIDIVLQILRGANGFSPTPNISSLASFGCSTGEEVFTLALASALYPSITISGYDLYAERLTVAASGYLGREGMFKETLGEFFADAGPREIYPALLATSHLHLSGDLLRVGDGMRSRISLHHHDLLRKKVLATHQIGLLCNVLQHYPLEERKTVIQNCATSIDTAGFLIVSDVLINNSERAVKYGIADGVIQCDGFSLIRRPWAATRQHVLAENPLLFQKIPTP